MAEMATLNGLARLVNLMDTLNWQNPLEIPHFELNTDLIFSKL